jgi:hypothetical protein
MYPDQITPRDNATAIFYYNTTQTKTGAIRSTANQSKVVYFGVGLEMVQTEAVRNDILDRTYDWFMETVGLNETGKPGIVFMNQIYPNPAGESVNILLSNTEPGMTIQISDLTGKPLVESTFPTNSEKIAVSTSGLKNGTYLVSLLRDGRKLETKKLTILNW